MRASRSSRKRRSLIFQLAQLSPWKRLRKGVPSGSQHHVGRTQPPEMVEQEIARGVAHHLVQRRPRRLRIERIVEQLLDPGGEQVLACAIPAVAQGPGASRRGARPARFVRAHLDLARDRTASCSRLLGRERRMPGARRGRLDLGEPEIRRAAPPPPPAPAPPPPPPPTPHPLPSPPLRP